MTPICVQDSEVYRRALVLISSALSEGASLLSEVSELGPVASPCTCGACPSCCLPESLFYLRARLMILILIPRLINDLNTYIRGRQAGRSLIFFF